jgi:two-component system response regulator AtoC
MVDVASTGAEGLEKVRELRPQVVILDMRLPDTDGLSVLRQGARGGPAAPGHHHHRPRRRADGGGRHEARRLRLRAQALRDGGHCPRRGVGGATFKQATELDLYRRRAWQHYSGEEIIGKSDPMSQVRGLIEKVVRSKATSVLITGESGTGKELVARAIHYRSDRAQAPLMEVNCSSFQEALLENELFGHEKGAYTTRPTSRRGLVELCDGGTLFLDEVADMPLPTQAKLLRFIDHRNFKRVGRGAGHRRGHPHRGGRRTRTWTRRSGSDGSATTCTSASRS